MLSKFVHNLYIKLEPCRSLHFVFLALLLLLVRHTCSYTLKCFELSHFCEFNTHATVLQLNLFLHRLHGDRIGFSVLGMFVIEKNTTLKVSKYYIFTTNLSRFY